MLPPSCECDQHFHAAGKCYAGEIQGGHRQRTGEGVRGLTQLSASQQLLLVLLVVCRSHPRAVLLLGCCCPVRVCAAAPLHLPRAVGAWHGLCQALPRAARGGRLTVMHGAAAAAALRAEQELKQQRRRQHVVCSLQHRQACRGLRQACGAQAAAAGLAAGSLAGLECSVCSQPLQQCAVCVDAGTVASSAVPSGAVQCPWECYWTTC